MIYIDCPMQQDLIIDLLQNVAGEIKYKFVEKTGIRLSFEVDTDDLDKAIMMAKNWIRSSDIGKVLYFQITK